MRFLANENFPFPVINQLRREGHDVLWARDVMHKAKDELVLARAQFENRVLITLDKDFGELAFKRGLQAASGIVLFRLRATTPQHDNERMVKALLCREHWEGYYSVVDDCRIRMRPLGRSRDLDGPGR